MRNIKPIFVLLATLVLSGCQLIMPVEYDDNDGHIRSSVTSDEKLWHAMNVIDTAQTIHLARSPECYSESNFLTKKLIGEHPSTEQAIAVGILYSLVYRMTNQYIEDRITYTADGYYGNGWGVAKITLSVLGLVTKGFTISSNHVIGMKPFGSGC